MARKGQDDQKPSKGYGKHSVGYWAVVYVIIAIIVYSLVYLLFLHKGDGGGGDGGNPSPSY